MGYRGHQGAEYLNAVRMLAGAEVVGLVDPVPDERDEALVGRAPVFTTTQQMLHNVIPDVTVVTVPHSQHFAIAAELVSAGSHVVVEKPLVPTSAQAEDLYDLSRRSGKSILTTTQRPFRPEFLYLEHALRLIGDVYWVDWRYSMAFAEPTSGWRSEWEHARGGVLLDMGYHAIDVLVRMFGPARVSSARKRYRYDQSRREDLEDLVSASLDFPDRDLSCHLFVARHAREKTETIEVHGTRGTIAMDVRGASVVVCAEDGSLLDEYRGPASAVDVPAVALGHYLDLTRDHDRSLAHLRHHMALVALCEEIYRTASSTVAASTAS